MRVTREELKEGLTRIVVYLLREQHLDFPSGQVFEATTLEELKASLPKYDFQDVDLQDNQIYIYDHGSWYTINGRKIVINDE